jgi:hypothetical protein
VKPLLDGRSWIYATAGEAALRLLPIQLGIFQILRRVKAKQLSSMYIIHHWTTLQR